MNDLNSRIQRASEWTAMQLTSGNAHNAPIAELSCLINAAAKAERLREALQRLNDATNPFFDDQRELHDARVIAQNILAELK